MRARVRHRLGVALLVVAAGAGGTAMVLHPTGPPGPILVLAAILGGLTAPLAAVSSIRGNRALVVAWGLLAVVLLTMARGREAGAAMGFLFAGGSAAITWARGRGGVWVGWVAALVVVLGGPAAWALAWALWGLSSHPAPPAASVWGEPGPFGGEGGAFYALITWGFVAVFLVIEGIAAVWLPVAGRPEPTGGAGSPPG